MSRTMTDSNASVFRRLLEAIPAGYANYHLINKNIPRSINRNGDDSEWLQNALIKNRITCHLEKEVITIEFNQKKYIVFYDDNPNVTAPFMLNIVSREVLNPGLLTILYSDEGCIPLNLSLGFEDELVNNIFGITDERFDVAIVSNYFHSLEIWRLDESVDLSNSSELYKFYSGRMISDPNRLSLNFSPGSLTHIKALLENSYTVILSDKIFKAITSIHWVQAYLEFYRCIEFLYKIPYITEFHGVLQAYDFDGGIMLKVAKGLDSLGWKKNEEQAIINLYKYFDNTNSKIRLHNALFPDEAHDSNIEVMSTRIAKGLYHIRNKLVHWRKDSDRLLEGAYDWNIIVTEICVFLDQKYEFYSYEIDLISNG
ncbi:hypothetical protein [Maribacter arcticus]|uniref:hypothetical protein n=1 Tax=Maribacter arcticus TaxID=561365 RepID=UPI003002737C